MSLKLELCLALTLYLVAFHRAASQCLGESVSYGRVPYTVVSVSVRQNSRPLLKAGGCVVLGCSHAYCVSSAHCL